MQRYKPLRPSEDINSRWSKFTNFSHTAQHTFVEININEITNVLSQNIIVFVKLDTGDFRLVALQGVFENENLFINENGQWIGSYIPDKYKNYPFILQNVSLKDNADIRKVLSFDMQSNLYVDTPQGLDTECKFFDENKQIDPLVQKILQNLENISQYTEMTNKAIELLHKYELLSPLGLKFDTTNDERVLQQGIYKIDEQKLNALAPEILKELQEVHALSIAYAQMFSMSRVLTLKKLYDIKQEQKKVSIDNIDLDEFFKDDKLNFGF